jgi:hypothetical protein
MARPKQPQRCCSSICRREIQPWEKGVEFVIFGRTWGMKKRRTSKSERIFLCPQCSTRNATGKVPSALDPVELAFFRVNLDLNGSEPDVVEATYEQLADRRQELLYPPALGQGEILPPEKRLKEAS